MLTRIYIDNYKCFSNFEWHPSKLVLLAGRNGSGKSALLEVLGGITGMFWLSTNLAWHFPSTSLTRWDQRKEQRVELEVTTPEGEFLYELRVDHARAKGKVVVSQERLYRNGHPLVEFDGRETTLYRDDGTVISKTPMDGSRPVTPTIPSLDDTSKVTAFRAAMARAWWIRPDVRVLVGSARGEREAPSLGLDDFVAWYRRASGDAIKLNVLMEYLKPLFKDFLGLRLDATGRDERTLQAVFQGLAIGGKKGAQLTFDFDELSDGQRLLIALYALLAFGPVQDGLLCLDEPDNYLALEEIEPWLKELEAAVEEGDGQVFLASHNSEVINRLWRTHGVWFERDGNGPVRVRPGADLGDLTPAEAMARGWT